jgi:hypothetical protein
VPERVLTLRELNRTTLLRQLLLRRARLGVAQAIERLGGLQAQEPRSPYLALWTRLERFRRETLERALRRDAVVKATLMRVTLHLVSARDHALFAGALEESWRRRSRAPTGPRVERMIDRIVARSAERPLKRAEVFELFVNELGEGVAQRVVDLAFFGAFRRLRQTPDCAMWGFRGAVSYVPAGASADAEAGRRHLVRRYLRAFGPASRADLSQWSGLPLADLDRALEQVRLRQFRDEDGRVLLDLPRAPIASAGDVAPPRLLPMFDELMVAYERRGRVLPDEYRRIVIRAGIVDPTILVDGFVAGRWRLEQGRVVLEPFGRLPRAARAALEDEARRLDAFVR